MDLLIFTLVVLGVTNIIVREYVFNWFRKIFEKHFRYSLINKLIHCETCTGFWVGVLFWFLFPVQYETIYLTMFVSGVVSSISNKLVAIILMKF